MTDLVFDKTITKSARVLFDIFRKTDTANFTEVGEMFLVYNPEDDDWDISINSSFDDAGVIFTVTSAGQVQYTSDSIAGGSYEGTLKLKNVTKVSI